jgi:hypothetical protein
MAVAVVRGQDKEEDKKKETHTQTVNTTPTLGATSSGRESLEKERNTRRQ